MIPIPPVATAPERPVTANPAVSDDQKRQLAQEFEAVILAEFLRAAGSEGIIREFGGGIGEEQFASMLTDIHAEAMAARGGLGIAEMVLRAMMANDPAQETQP